MPDPITFNPHVDGRGHATMRPAADGSGKFVAKADYDALAQRFYASNRAIATLEAEPAKNAEGADGESEA